MLTLNKENMIAQEDIAPTSIPIMVPRRLPNKLEIYKLKRTL